MKNGFIALGCLALCFSVAKDASAGAGPISLACNLFFHCADTEDCIAQTTKASFQGQMPENGNVATVGDFAWEHILEGEGILKVASWSDFEIYRVTHHADDGSFVHLIVGRDGTGVLSRRAIKDDFNFHQLFYGRCEVAF